MVLINFTHLTKFSYEIGYCTKLLNITVMKCGNIFNIKVFIPYLQMFKGMHTEVQLACCCTNRRHGIGTRWSLEVYILLWSTTYKVFMVSLNSHTINAKKDFMLQRCIISCSLHVVLAKCCF